MHAFAVLSADDRSIVDIELPTPEPAGNEVRLRVLHSGVCHSDVHLREGSWDLGSAGSLDMASGQKYPLVMGHETVGVVEAVGSEVTGVKVGEVRLVYPWIGCGACEECQAGRENLCVTAPALGIAKPGGYADTILVPHERYLLDIEGLDPAWAATLACSGLTSYSAARKALPADPTSPVVVIGAGGVGLMAIAALRALGHPAVIAVDLNERNLELATDLGASATVSATEPKLAAAIFAAAGGPASSVIDFVNSSSTAPVAFAVLRKGGRMVQVGLFGGELVVPTVMLPLKVATIQGSYVGTLDELRELVEIAKTGGLPHPPISTAELSAARVEETLDRLKAGGVPGRIVLSA
jgi:alcohol dehydrogenase/propanol-preferring alcohol dehydrogenase